MGKTLLFQGDSITDAGRTSSPNRDTDLGNGYPKFIAPRLWAEEPERGWNILNRGISGHRVVDLYARWKVDCVNLNPDFLSILIGVNDTWHEFDNHNGVEVPRYEEFYRKLLDWALQSNPNLKLILMEPYVLPFGAVTEAWLPEMDARREVVRRIAKDYDTLFVPLQEVLNEATKRAPGNHWLADGVHPTLAGHWLIAEAWLKVARPILK